MIKHPVLERKPAICQHGRCERKPEVWFKGQWVCMDHAEQDGLGDAIETNNERNDMTEQECLQVPQRCDHTGCTCAAEPSDSAFCVYHHHNADAPYGSPPDGL